MLDNKFQIPNFSSFQSPNLLPPDLPIMEIKPRQVSVVEDEKSFNQLIILGNGFDLACGLKSTYKDFFDQVLYKDKNKNNYWYHIFKTLSTKDQINNGWTDIEKQILTELKNLEVLYSEEVFIEKEKDIKKASEYFLSNLSPEQRDTFKLTIDATILAVDTHYWSLPSKQELQSHLIEKLLLLERDFFTYLNEQISIEKTYIDDFFTDNKEISQNNYYIKSLIIGYFLLISQVPKLSLGTLQSKLEKIEENDSFDSFSKQVESIKELFLDDDIEIIKSNVLSFNYTEPFKNLNIRNIHGALSEDNIIFGIDYDKLKINFKQPPIEFSKSYRILENGRTTAMSITSDIDIIKFYGHGLGEADYSYFQAIFDSVDLYHSNTKIIFYWSGYEGVEKTKIRIEQVKKVTNLIEEYGTTFTNKDHGRNLLTKLQLENRLQIEEIPIDDMFNYLN